MTSAIGGTTRFDRRRAQTRAALISAAQDFLAEGRADAPINEVTGRANVAIGSFYNHFSSKDELFASAVTDAFERYAILLDALSGDLPDPAARFARSFRLTGHLHRRHPQLSRILLAEGHVLARSSVGVAPRARRDLLEATAAGRFTATDIDRAMVLVTGATIELGYLLHDQPSRDVTSTVDGVTTDVLVALGLPRDEAADLCAESLPIVSSLL
jgi:AcrR family transcriptional regulator